MEKKVILPQIENSVIMIYFMYRCKGPWTYHVITLGEGGGVRTKTITYYILDIEEHGTEFCLRKLEFNTISQIQKNHHSSII